MEKYALTTRRLPTSLEQLLYSNLLPRSDQLQNVTWLADFRDAIRRDYIPDYQTDAEAFCYLYFGANFFKVLIALGSLASLQELNISKIRILDIGCGSGASSAAVLHALNSEFNGKCFHCEFMGVDENREQLTLYENIFCAWAGTFSNVKAHTALVDAFEYLKCHPDSWDIIICSYLLTENPPEQRNALMDLLGKIAKNFHTQILVIDSDPENKIPTAWLVGQSQIILSDNMQVKFDRLHLLSKDCCPKYCSHKAPKIPPVRAPELLERYFDCWRHHDLKVLRELFDASATYEINGQRTLHGLNEIAAYWEQNAREQENVTYMIHHAVSAGVNSVVNWSCNFLRSDKGQFYYVHGIIWMILADEKIMSLREYYSKNTFSISIPVKPD